MDGLRRDSFIGEFRERHDFRARGPIAELIGFGSGDLAARRAHLLRCNGELRFLTRQIRRCANILFAGGARLAQSLKRALEMCVTFMKRWLVDCGETASTFANIATKAVFPIAIRRELLRQLDYFTFQTRRYFPGFSAPPRRHCGAVLFENDALL